VLLNGDVYFESDRRPVAMPDFFSAVYGRLKMEYRRFYRMDALSKLGFLASELLLVSVVDPALFGEDTGIVFFNRSASLETDRKYQQTIQDKTNFFPSPSDFVYTLPNIVTGEIAIRNGIYGETAFYVLPCFQADSLYDAIESTVRCAGMKYVLAGWVEVDAFSGAFDCLMTLCERNAEDGLMLPLNVDTLEHLWESPTVSLPPSPENHGL
jgi:hypothetical protein